MLTTKYNKKIKKKEYKKVNYVIKYKFTLNINSHVFIYVILLSFNK